MPRLGLIVCQGILPTHLNKWLKCFLENISTFHGDEARNEITNFCQRPDELLFKARERYKLSIDRCPNHNMLPVTQIDTFYNVLTLRHRDTINAATGGTFMKRHPEECYDLIKNMTAHHNDWDTSIQRSESSSSITSSSDMEIIGLKAEMAKINKNIIKVLQLNQQLKAALITMKLVVVLILTMIVQPPLAKLRTYMLREPIIKDTVPPTNNGSTKDVQPLVVQIENLIPNSEPVVAPVVKPVMALVGAPKPNPKPSIPYPSRLHDQKLRDKTNDPKEKIFQIFQDLNFNISSRMLSFSCLTLAELGASINLMPLSVWNKISLPKLSPTCTTLKLVDRSISHPVRVTIVVFVKVGTFHFSTDFVVVDFDADPRVPLILMRSLLKTGSAFIDVYEGELTLRVAKDAVTFNLDQTLRYSANYDAMSLSELI
nr:reverse transcriptase domain-containing protein [Tanacetum cinerariifolium]